MNFLTFPKHDDLYFAEIHSHSKTIRHSFKMSNCSWRLAIEYDVSTTSSAKSSKRTLLYFEQVECHSETRLTLIYEERKETE